LAFVAALAALVFARGALAQEREDTVPGARLPASVAPKSYDAELSIDPAQPTFSGTITIHMRIEQPVDTLWLNATKLTLHEAKLLPADGKGEAISATIVPGSDDVVGLRFGQKIAAGTARVSIRYSGPIDAVSTSGVFRQKTGDAWYVYTQFEALDARRAFPIFDEPSFKARWRLTIVAPEGNRAFANMSIESERVSSPGFREFKFASTPPLSSYLVAFAVGPFDVLDAGTAGANRTAIRIIAPRGRASEAAFAARETGPILAALERYFARPYPFAKLDLIALPSAGFAMENPGLVVFGGKSLLARSDEVTPDFQQRFVATAAHELSHMWFGDLVTMAWWDDLWLNEAFASWLGTRITAELKPAWRWELGLAERRGWAIAADRLASSHPIRKPIAERNDVAAMFDGISYAKGQAVLTMMEAWLGPERFRDAVRRYIAAHEWGNATADDFVSALAQGDESVIASFRGFIDRPGVPLVDVALDCSAKPFVRFTQQRLLPVGAIGATVPPWSFPACVKYGDDKRSREQCMLVRATDTTMALDTPACPRFLVANRGGIGYYVPRLTRSGYAALDKSDKALGPADLVPLLSDVDMLAQSGALDYAVALTLSARYAAHPDPRVARAAFLILDHFPRALVSPQNSAHFAQWVKRNFRTRARALGWLPRGAESPDIAQLRELALPLVADLAQDEPLGHEARVLVARWQKNPRALPVQMRQGILVTAARSTRTGATALRDSYVAAALSPKRDENERQDLLAAIGAFRDPKLVQMGAALALDDRFEPRDAILPLQFALGDPITRPIALSWVDANVEPLLARSPRWVQGTWPEYVAGACSTDERTVFARAFATRAPRYEAGAVRYAEAIEAIDLCLALRGAQQSAVNVFFAAVR
jgi:alanyl aminopeptidase